MYSLSLDLIHLTFKKELDICFYFFMKLWWNEDPNSRSSMKEIGLWSKEGRSYQKVNYLLDFQLFHNDSLQMTEVSSWDYRAIGKVTTLWLLNVVVSEGGNFQQLFQIEIWPFVEEPHCSQIPLHFVLGIEGCGEIERNILYLLIQLSIAG